MDESQEDNYLHVRDDPDVKGTFQDEFYKALREAPITTLDRFVFKFDTELDIFTYTGFELGRMNGLPQGEIQQFDEILRNNCEENYHVNKIIDGAKTKNICGILTVLICLGLSVFIGVSMMGSLGMISSILLATFGLIIGCY